jgi:hypothetical protein
MLAGDLTALIASDLMAELRRRAKRRRLARHAPSQRDGGGTPPARWK